MSVIAIQSANGVTLRIDDVDAERVLQHRWRVYRYSANLYYASVAIGQQTVYLHRFITDAPKGFDVDHEDGDGLNNVRSNLRVVPHQFNIANQRLSEANTSGFKGVGCNKRHGTFYAQTKFRGQHINLGTYANPEEAARAYDRKVRALFGEFARTNESLGLLGPDDGAPLPRLEWHPPRFHGSKNKNARLTEALVIELRAEFAQGNITQLELARRHGLNPSLVSLVIRRKAWTHI